MGKTLILLLWSIVLIPRLAVQNSYARIKIAGYEQGSLASLRSLAVQKRCGF